MHKEDDLLGFDAMVGDCGCEVCFAAAIGSDEHKPANRVFSVLRRRATGIGEQVSAARILGDAFRFERMEREASEMTEITVSQQPSQSFLGEALLLTAANYHLAKVRMSDDDIGRVPSSSTTHGAGVFIPLVGWRQGPFACRAVGCPSSRA